VRTASLRGERRAMVRHQLAPRGIRDRRVLAAMASVPRHCFVPADLVHLAYADQPLPIGHDQTISQPYIVALMTQEARIGRRANVLEVGTGTGYHTAVLARLASHVWSIERIADLSAQAAARLDRLGITNVTLIVGDGAEGHPGASPFDAIIVEAAAPGSPEPLLRQLALGGRLIIPVGDRAFQVLHSVERTADGFREYSAGSVRFVPLVSPLAFLD